MKCATCNQEYSPGCDWQQGRCPQHPPMLNIQFCVRFVKSATRIAAGIALIWPQSVVLAGVFLIAAEIVGAVEEVV